MTAEVVASTEPGAADRAIGALRSGGVVVLPTDTVYGLAAAAHDATAVARLFAHKGRDADVPVAVLCADADQAFALAGAVPPLARRLAGAHWPGPLTLVLPRRADLDWALGEPSHTIGVRCPDHDLLRAIVAATGPLATTSANRHGQPTPPGAEEAAGSLVGAVDLVVDGGPVAGTASTVVDLADVPPRVLRSGPLVVDLSG